MTEIFAVNPRLCLHQIKVLYSIQNSFDFYIFSLKLLRYAVVGRRLFVPQQNTHLDMCNCPF